MTQCKALYDFNLGQTTANQLSFARGDFITLVKQMNNDWWLGTVRGSSEGLFPSAYVEVIQGSPAVALYDFNVDAANADQLSFQKGDTINVINKLNAEWWQGNFKGKDGLFPASYVSETGSAPHAPLPVPISGPTGGQANTTDDESSGDEGATPDGSHSVVIEGAHDDGHHSTSSASAAPASPSQPLARTTTIQAPTPVKEEKRAFKTGFLMKNKYINREDNWKARWFVLADGKLNWYADIMDQQPLGGVDTYNAKVSKGGHVTMSDGRKRENVFKVSAAKEDVLLQAPSYEEMVDWNKKITQASKEPPTQAAGGKDSVTKKKGGFFSRGSNKTEAPVNPGTQTRNTLMFGQSLEELMSRFPDHDLPPCVTHMMQHLEQRNALKQDGIFRVTGSSAEINKLKETYDKGLLPDLSKVDDDNVVTGALKLYFRQLPEPLLTYRLYDEWLKAMKSKREGDLEAYRNVVNALPPINRTLLASLMDFLYRVQQNAASNKMNASNLAIVFGPTLMPSAASKQAADQNMMYDTSKHNDVVEHLIVLTPQLFADQ